MSSGGKIITFYSYKGGTGRSMALANVAWILASRGKRVLAVDWDLEAPGLHRYFAPFLIDKELTATKGLIDLVTEFAAAAVTPVPEEQRGSGWHEKYAELRDYTVNVPWEFATPGRIDLLPAGRQGATYATRVNGFSWQSFYERLGGGAFLESVRGNMRQRYDYVLIDSRTGVSDTSGICTVQMPDALVVLFTGNNQSIEGSAAIAKSVDQQWSSSGSRSRAIFPVMTRLDTFEKDKLDARKKVSRERFDRYVVTQLKRTVDEYWGGVNLPYIPWYSYEEVLSAFGDQPDDRASITAACEHLCAEITGGEVTSLVWPTDEQRSRVRADYARSHALDRGYDAFLDYEPDDRALVSTIAAYLRDVGLKCWFDELDLEPGAVMQEAMEFALAASKSVVVFQGETRTKSRMIPPSSETREIPVLLPGAKPPEISDRRELDMRRGATPEALYRLESAIRGVRADPRKLAELTAMRRRKKLYRTVIVAAPAVGVMLLGGTYAARLLTPGGVAPQPRCGIPASNFEKPSSRTGDWCSAVGTTDRVSCREPMPGGGHIAGICLRGVAMEYWIATDAGNKQVWAGTFDQDGQRDGDWQITTNFNAESVPGISKWEHGKWLGTTARLSTGATVAQVPTGDGSNASLQFSCGPTRTTQTDMPTGRMFYINDGAVSYQGLLDQKDSPAGVWEVVQKGVRTNVDLDKLSSEDRLAWDGLTFAVEQNTLNINACEKFSLPLPTCGDASVWKPGAGCVPKTTKYIGTCVIEGDRLVELERTKCPPSRQVPSDETPDLRDRAAKAYFFCTKFLECKK